jgi:DNA-binding FadR family transcriptional regulator
MAKALYERIVEHYAGLIRVGEMKPGDWLPTQAQIAHAWQCSLTPVKHAMYELEHAGLIENYQGKGARVTQQEAPRP